MPQSYAPLLNIVNNFHPFKQRVRPQAFALSCLLHIAVGTIIFFVARKFAFEQWPSMGPKSDNLNVVQMELLTAAASPVQPVAPSVNPPPPEPAEVPLAELQKPPEPAPQPEPEVSRPAEASAESQAPVETQPAQTAQVSQRASVPGAQVAAAEPLAGQSRTGEIYWRKLATAKVLAMVEHEKYYPEAARRAGYTGWCLVQVRLAADGTVLGYEVKDRRGNPLLRKGAEAALKKIQGCNIGVKLPEPLDIPLRIEFTLK